MGGLLEILEKVKRQYKYIRAQDLPLWRGFLFLAEAPEQIFRAIFVRNSGSDFLAAESINPNDLCIEISQAIDICEKVLLEYHQEFETDSKFHQAIQDKLKLTAERVNKMPQYGWREFLYLVVRAIRPNIMIETGSFDGLGTAVILLAMDKNNRGVLYTIDLPNPRLPQDMKAEPAWIVPDYLRARLELRIGKSSEHLEQVIEQAGGAVDMFYHDSWHTYENMIFEYQTIWSALRPGGYLMSEYLPGRKGASKAFNDFAMTKAEKPVIVANGTQFILRKR